MNLKNYRIQTYIRFKKIDFNFFIKNIIIFLRGKKSQKKKHILL